MAEEKRPGPGAVDSDADFDPAVEWFRKREAMSRAQVDALTLEKRRQVFFVTGLSDLEAIKAVQDSLARSLGQGETFEEWKEKVKAQGLFKSPEFTEHRLETIFRTNLQNAFATGRYMEMTAPAVLKRRPYWRFSAVKDSRTTKVCQACAGTILPADHPWWKSHVPPLHFNCRSTFVPMTEKDAQAAGITAHPPEVRAALGFGSPPFGVPAAARDLPTEAQREAAEKVSEEVQTAVEERQNASSELTAAKHEKSVADKKLREAKKELIRAPQNDVPARRKDVEEAQKAAEAAGKHVETAKKELEKADKHVEKVMAANENKPRGWTLVPERLKRLAKGVAAPAVGLWKKILAVLAGVDLAALGRGATVRSLGPAPKGTQSKALKKLDKTKWGHLPKHIRENVEAIANKEGGPNLLAEQETIEEALRKVNPNYKGGTVEYMINCPCTTVALEARLRGLDVEAAPKQKVKNGNKDISKYPFSFSGFVHDDKQTKGALGGTTTKLKAAIENEMKKEPDGSRFILFAHWKTRGAHVFSAYKEEGKIYFVDAQPNGENKQLDCSEYFKDFSTKKPVYFLRVDNLVFSGEVKKFLKPAHEGDSK